ncbi:hypothetical protein CICLE_v10010856mg [Citrus x clementina]|uniref:Uncharacterized protein n=1 Tax=Citrus clementina TaxID=85681 RepID=V4U010_CITCL|nr:hypothetical protein CICLE_v10010856mg [Citrus x clementina]
MYVSCKTLTFAKDSSFSADIITTLRVSGQNQIRNLSPSAISVCSSTKRLWLRWSRSTMEHESQPHMQSDK